MDNKELFDENSIKQEPSEFEVEPDIDPATVDTSGLFETPPKSDVSEEDTKTSKQTEKAEDVDHKESHKVYAEMDNVPAPTEKAEDVVEDSVNDYIAKSKEIADSVWGADEIIAMITSTNEEGQSPATIYVALERISNVTENMSIEDIKEDDREMVEDLVVKDCTIDMFSMTTDIANLVFNFDSPKSAYLQEFYSILNRYRMMQEALAQENKDNVLPMISISIVPEHLMGQGIMMAAFPLAFFRTLDDSGLNTSLHTLFYTENIQFSRIEITEEEQREAIADVMRDMSSGTGGDLF